jgi:hypothetical protein
MPDYALTVKTPNRQNLRTEEGGTVEATPDIFSGGGPTGAATSFVYRPGGVAGQEGVFVTAAALKAALLTVDPQADKTIVVDTTFATAHLTAVDSPWPLDNATFESGPVVAVLVLDSGCTFAAGTNCVRLRDIQVNVDPANAAPIWNVTGLGAFLDMHLASLSSGAASAPFADVAGGSQLGIVLAAESQLQSGGTPLFKVENTGLATVAAFDASTVQASVFVHGAVPGGTLNLAFDGSSLPLVSIAQDSANLAVTPLALNPQTVFVYRPGGVAGGNVYTSWPTLAAALSVTPGPKTIGVDTSLGAAHVTVGTWQIGDVKFQGMGGSPIALLTVDDGAHLGTSTSNVTAERCTILCAGTSAVWTPAAAAVVVLQNEGSILTTTAAGQFVDAGVSVTFLLSSGGSLGDGTHAMCTVEAAGAISLFASGGSTVSANAFKHGTVAGGTLAITLDGSCQALVSQVQDNANLTVTFLNEDPLTAFVFQPGGIAGGNVYTTWQALYAAASLSSGPIWVFVNDNDGARPAHVTAGTYNVQNWTFQGAQRPVTVPGAAQLIFDDGAVFVFNKLRLQFIKFVQNGNTVPVWTAPAGQSRVWIAEQTVLCPTPLAVAAVPWGALPNGATLVLNIVGSTIGDGTHAAISMVAGSTLIAVCISGNVTANAVSGGAGTFTLSVDNATTVNLTQAPVPTVSFLSNAALDAYTPAVPGNWQPAPTLVSGAFDQLAAPNVIQGFLAAGSGAVATLTVPTGNIAKLRSGKVQVDGFIGGSNSQAATITVTLLRDAAVIATYPPIVMGAAGNWAAGLNVLDTLPDTANHTYSIKASVSAGTITVVGNASAALSNALLVAQEC